MMTHEEQTALRIRCAEIEGVTDFYLYNGDLWGFLNGEPGGTHDYCNDTNAINAAVLRLDEDLSWKFLIELSKLNPRGASVWPAWTDQDVYFIATASAIDRCKAFLKVHE